MERQFEPRARVIEHKGVEIIINDCSGISGARLREVMKENTKFIVTKVVGRNDCVIVNLFKDSVFDEDSLKYMTKLQKSMDGIFVASANVGMSAAQKAAVQIIDALKSTHFAFKFFDDPEQAIDWAAETHRKVTATAS